MISRSAEFRAVADFLLSAERQPTGLVIEGEAGIGKTTVWLAAVDQARERGFRVFSAHVGTRIREEPLATMIGKSCTRSSVEPEPTPQ